MTSTVPYLPISEFERKSSSELVKKLQDYEDGDTENLIGQTIPKHSGAGDEYSQCVELVLHGMGMQKYCSLFEEEDIGIDIFIGMKDDDLLKLGIIDSQDRKTIMEQLEQFQIENNSLPYCVKENENNDFEEIEDYIKMTGNVSKHLVELNSYLAYLQSQLSENPPSDYFICNHETGLEFLKFAIKHASIQSNRISCLLFDGQFHGKNLITEALSVNKVTLPQRMMEKLTGLYKKKRRLRKGRLIATVVLGMAIIFAVNVISQKTINHPTILP